jgi:hypothetical protein
MRPSKNLSRIVPIPVREEEKEEEFSLVLV